MSARVLAAVWPRARLAEAIEALARGAGLEPRGHDVLPAPPEGADEAALTRWAVDAAAWLGVDAEPIEAGYSDLGALVSRSAPALLHARDAGGYLAVISSGPEEATLLDPREETVAVRAEEIAAALAAHLTNLVGPRVDALLDRAGVRPKRRAVARRALLDARLAGARVGEGSFLLALPAGAGLARHAGRIGIGRRLALFLATAAASQALFIASFALLGKGALSGRVDRGWLAAWGLVLLSQVPVRLAAVWLGGRVGLDASALMKQRLLAGALELEPDAVRGEGAGALFGRVVESEALEAAALGGGVAGAVALIELAFAAAVLSLGVAPAAHLGALLAWIAAAGLAASRYLVARRRWTQARLSMTQDLVERMVGHRTRVAQERPDRWHDGEDRALAAYVDRSARMDRLGVLLTSAVPGGFLVLGIALLVPAFAQGRAPAGALAVSLGGVLLAVRAFTRLAAGLAELGSAVIAFRAAAPLLDAAARTPAAPPPGDLRAPAGDEAVVDARRLTFRHPGRAAPVLAEVSLRVAPGDRLLLEGASGSGKSTLGAALAGLREVASGLLLVAGLDRHALGPRGLRRRVAVAPQFHDNHVFTGTFAYNLLMGREWPPRPEDLVLAREICDELDLGPLLDRMPGGLSQMVGETGWQLSHGERSRLFIARALLQGADLIILDESFAALDPDTLGRVMGCVRRRANALLVIAHP